MATPLYIGINTLIYEPDACINCGMCINVCPHGVFEAGKNNVVLAKPADCMECGACMVNCPVNAIYVDSGVGCAAAMILSALKGQKEVTCGDDNCGGGSSCC